jgi:hypothetical protein
MWGLRQLLARGMFINCGLHINEFTDRADVAGCPEQFYYTEQLMRVPLTTRLKYFDTVFEHIRRHCDIVLLRDVTA